MVRVAVRATLRARVRGTVSVRVRVWGYGRVLWSLSVR